MLERVEQEKDLTEQLLRAIRQDELCIYLQPKVSLETNQVVGAEALVRWESPEHGLIAPGAFIPLAEKTGTIHEIDWLVFEKVCRTLYRWQAEGKPLLLISFNLSRSQLDIPDFLDHYRSILTKYAIPPHCFNLSLQRACSMSGWMSSSRQFLKYIRWAASVRWMISGSATPLWAYLANSRLIFSSWTAPFSSLMQTRTAATAGS